MRFLWLVEMRLDGFFCRVVIRMRGRAGGILMGLGEESVAFRLSDGAFFCVIRCTRVAVVFLGEVKLILREYDIYKTIYI